MGEYKFEQILEYLCSGIMSKSERQSVRDELYDHLMCKYETNLAIGMSEEDAENKAIEALGDKSVLKFKLSQVHSYAPKPTLKKAMKLLISGYVLTVFQINFFEGMGDITKFIGNVIMLVAVFCMRKANPRLKQAFCTDAVSFVFAYLSVAVQPLILSGNWYVSTALSLVSLLLNLAFWILLILGLNDLVKPYTNECPQKIPFVFTGFCHFCTQGSIILLYLSALSVEEPLNFNSDIDGGFAVILIGIVFVTAVATLLVLTRVSKCLWGSDHEYKIEASSAKKVCAAAVAIVTALAPMLAVDLFVAAEKAETEVYSIDDSDISQAEYEQICSNILSYGVPERLVYTLPESEIEKFADSVPCPELAIPENYVYDDFQVRETYERGGVKFDVYSCAVGLLDEYGCSMVRFMVWIEYADDIKGNYSDYLTVDKPTIGIAPNFSEEYNGDLILLLTEENGRLMRNEPLEIYTDADYYVDSVSGVKFQAKDGLLLYYGTTFNVDREQDTVYRFMNLYHRTFPLTSMRNPPSRDSYNNYLIGFEPFRLTTKQWMPVLELDYETEITE